MHMCTASFHVSSIDVDNPPPDISTLYDLIANVTHESVAGTTRDKEHTAWKVYLRAAGRGESERWYMIQDLIVEETRKEMIFLGEAVLQVRTVLKITQSDPWPYLSIGAIYSQIWERRDKPNGENDKNIEADGKR